MEVEKINSSQVYQLVNNKLYKNSKVVNHLLNVANVVSSVSDDDTPEISLTEKIDQNDSATGSERDIESNSFNQENIPFPKKKIAHGLKN